MNEELLWSKFLDQIKDELTSLSFKTWFEETKLYKIEEGKAYIIVPMPIHKKHLIENYETIIINKLQEITGSQYDLEFLLEEEIEQIKKEDKVSNTNSNVINNEEKVGYEATNLQKKLNFENFVVGNSNKFAQAAALSVAENPGQMYNPFFIYGNSGLGKTHLMQAIGNYIVDNSDKRVLYVE